MSLNYYHICATLGATIGPRMSAGTGPLTYGTVARKMLHSIRTRGPFASDLRDQGSADSRFVRRLRAALESVRDGFSPDRVIADPTLNEAFLERCETFGLEHSPFHINRSVLALRKAGELAGLHSKRTTIPNQFRFAYGCEIAGRAICLRNGVSIDTMLCHPKLVREFDELAAQLAPVAGVFEHRWCVLNIRKRGLAGLDSARRRIRRIRWSRRCCLGELQEVPAVPGISELFEQDRLLFVNESDNLATSAEQQKRALSVAALDRELWSPRPDQLYWRFSVINPGKLITPALVTAIVGEYNPLFNIPRGGRKRAA